VPSSAEAARRRIPWRRWNNAIHRDVGYLCAALTLAYAVSGIAVNHIQDWNPNYRIVREEIRFEPVPVGTRDEMVEALVERLALGEPPRDSFRSRPDQVELFYDGWSVKADATSGTAVVERPRERPVLFDLNFLHLNRPGGLWTWVADLYAALLAVLAVTGLFVLKGKVGLAGRGRWWGLAGLAVPLAFLLFLRWL
jgi:hypothetical protein